MPAERAAVSRIIVALDTPSPEDARRLIDRIGPSVQTYKIGLELIYGGGLALARELIAEGKRIFIDAKLLDIGHTVERATAQIARLGAHFLTVHATDSKTLQAAVRGRGQSGLKLLGVTVMTNLDFRDLAEQGVTHPPREMVLHRAQLAAEAGFDGVIASAQEAAAIRSELGTDFLIVTPGIRPAGAERGDQARVATPTSAIGDGADYLVIGRPITQAPDPGAAATAIAAEIADALSTQA